METETPEIANSLAKQIERHKRSWLKKKPRLTFEDRLAKAREVRAKKNGEKNSALPLYQYLCSEKSSDDKICDEKSSDDKICEENSSDEKILPEKKFCYLDIRLAVLERRLTELKEKARLKKLEIRKALEESRNTKGKKEDPGFLNGFSARCSSHPKQQKAKPNGKRRSLQKLQAYQLQVKAEPVDSQEMLSTSAADLAGSSQVEVKTEPLEFFEETPFPVIDLSLNPVQLLGAAPGTTASTSDSSNWDYMVMEIEVEPDESVESLFTLVQKDAAPLKVCDGRKEES